MMMQRKREKYTLRDKESWTTYFRASTNSPGSRKQELHRN